MNIQRLEISGFRSLEHVIWEPGPLNVLIGMNGSGKSNLLRAVQMLKHAADGNLSETVRAWGGMAPLVWDGQATTIHFHLQLDDPSLGYELAMERLGQSGAFQVSREVLTILGPPSDKSRPLLTHDGQWISIDKTTKAAKERFFNRK